jgi:hypothetical protein
MTTPARGAYLTASRAEAIERRMHELEATINRRMDVLEREHAAVRRFNADVIRALAGALLDALQRIGGSV